MTLADFQWLSLSLADLLLLGIAIAAVVCIHFERMDEAEDAAAERGKRNLGRAP